MEAYIGGRRVIVTPTMSIGKGGEADIFDVGGVALKLFKPSDHPDLAGEPEEQTKAKRRIEEHQRKLPAFPKNLPPKVVVPMDLAKNRSGQIIGYTMRFLRGAEVLLRYADKIFRQGVDPNDVIAIFRDMHPTVDAIHRAGTVIGDFNDLNVLVSGTEAYFIDADSFQFDRFFCLAYTERFVDPLLCDAQDKRPKLVKPYRAESDWYAFAIMLMECLLYVDPYGGIYNPKRTADRILHVTRPLKRITVFHSEVRYPKPAIPFKVLPDDLLHELQQIFEKDKRGVFPSRLLQSLRWTKCTACGAEHARSVCPECAVAAPSVKEVTMVRGRVTATRIFQTSGIILFATQQDKLRWLYHDGSYRREDGSVILQGNVEPQMRFRIRGDATLIGKENRLVTLTQGAEPDVTMVDTYGTLPVFDANGQNRYWLCNGQLMKDGNIAPQYIGNVLQGQTLFWVGTHFGFGFYRAGNINVAFVFDAERQGINDNVKIPQIRGQLIDSTCVFSRELCWFFIATREGGKTINRCYVIRRDGAVIASDEAEEGSDSWLSSLRGKCAAGSFLLAATDDGIVRLETNSDKIERTKEFPDTEPFVSAASHLFPGQEGIYVVDRREIHLIKIA